MGDVAMGAQEPIDLTQMAADAQIARVNQQSMSCMTFPWDAISATCCSSISVLAS